MEFNLDDFEIIRKVSGQRVTADVVRVTSHTLAIGENVFEQFVTNKGGDSISIEILYNDKAKALLLREPDGRDVFTLTKTKKLYSHTAHMALPRSFKTRGISKGLYRAVPEHPGVFVLDESEGETKVPNTSPFLKYRVEDTNFEVGDIVCWPYRIEKERVAEELKDKVPSSTIAIGTGRILEFYIGRDGQTKAILKPITEIFGFYYPDRVKVYAELDKLIIREKHNAS